MSEFEANVWEFLKGHFSGVEQLVDNGFHIFSCDMLNDVNVVAVPVVSRTLEDAYMQADRLKETISGIDRAIVLTEDLWWSRTDMMRFRLLAQFGVFRSVFARNTEVRRIDKIVSAEFFGNCHTYGDAAARFRYGVFQKDGTMVAAASFSSPRTWNKETGIVKSCEWVRYASLPDVRVAGGMGKVLKTFVNEVHPDNVMSYADREWTDGSVYTRLGFKEEKMREPVAFVVDPVTYRRMPLKYAGEMQDALYHVNMGSVKYRLEL